MGIAKSGRLAAKFVTAAIACLLFCSVATAAESWPRSFTSVDGSTTEIPAKPQKILSTSVSLTGTLLAIHAPVAASGSAANGKFFAQWADVAGERKVESAWPAGKVDLEAVYAAQPDLIVVTASGAGSVKDQLDAFRQIAPTILVDDGALSWQDLATELGRATGLEEDAAASIADFDAYVAAARARIKILPEGQHHQLQWCRPEQPYWPRDRSARSPSCLARLLTSKTQIRRGIRRQKAATILSGQITNIWSISKPRPPSSCVWMTPRPPPSAMIRFLPTSLGKSGRVYGLGANSFRIDYYSGKEIVDGVVANFGH